jgi:hypothetical protein
MEATESRIAGLLTLAAVVVEPEAVLELLVPAVQVAVALVLLEPLLERQAQIIAAAAAVAGAVYLEVARFTRGVMAVQVSSFFPTPNPLHQPPYSIHPAP